MSRSKEETFKSFWIDVKVRRPPNTDERVLAWNEEYGCIREIAGRILNIQLDQIENVEGMEEKIRSDPLVKILDSYFATHWMKRWGPKKRKKALESALHCALCGLKQFSTPSGITCPNGHGGADSIEEGDGC